ncbi:MAG: DUF3078 domain-containing protein [Saprospiraceae bacterium]|nr:DUF3078 domain-containing protein [Saprospiraceae bacterium]
MLKQLLAFVLLVCTSQLFAQEAGDARLKEISGQTQFDTTLGWHYAAAVGLDLSGIKLFSPKVGAGTSRFGIGGLISLFANRKAAKSFWDNQLSLQLGMQELGRTSTTQPKGFQKSIDILRLQSRYGYEISRDGKWFAAADLFAQSQLLSTYASNYLEPVDAEDRVVSKFFSPVWMTFSPGINYKPNAYWSFFYSPVGVQYILVSDDAIAATGVHGNDVTRDPDGRIIEYENDFLGLGSELKVAYARKFWEDRLMATSNLRLYSNYLNEPQNIDILFTNNLDIRLFKGLSLGLVFEYFYDHDVRVQVDENDDGIYNVIVNPDGTTSGDDRLGRGGQTIGAFLLKYSHIF